VAETLDKWLKRWTIFDSLGRQKGGALNINSNSNSNQKHSKVK
jgi:hypothetical protein